MPCNQPVNNRSAAGHAAEPAAIASVLLVDDDQALCAMLAQYLAAEQFKVTAVHDGQASVTCIREQSFDAVVMDITMPVLDGFEALRQIRTFSTVPVLMLTARGDETDRIVGLEIGADDYLPKPFNPRELSARLKAILRRARLPVDQRGAAELQLGDLALTPGSQSVRVAGLPVQLTATEYGVLEMLVRSAGTVVRKEAISATVLGRRLTPYDRSLDTHIANLRKKIGPAADGNPRIKTVRGQGYLLVAG
jgi:two-component system response regulator CpxR